MRRSFINTLTGLMACGLLVSISIQPAAAQVAASDLINLASSTVAADHRALATRYRARAAEHETDAASHDALVADLKARPADDETWDLARDATHYAQHAREAAEALRDLAQHHEAIAERLGAPQSANTPAAGGCCGKGMGMADKGKAMACTTKCMADTKAPKPVEPGDHVH